MKRLTLEEAIAHIKSRGFFRTPIAIMVSKVMSGEWR